MTRLSKIRPYLMVLPAFLVLFCFAILPIFYMFFLSLFRWNMMSSMTFAGLKNYIELFQNEGFLQALRNTLIFVVWGVTFNVGLALLLALFLRKKMLLNRFLQSVVFAPHVISLVSIAFIWLWFMDPDFGLLNYLISLLGIPPSRWLNSPSTALNSLVIVAVWKGLGYDTLIILSGLQSIPKYLYEAAAMDKAKGFSSFTRITLPMLSPTLFFVILVNIIGYFKVFETIQIMTQGGPMNSTSTLVYYIYEYGFQYFKIGYASSAGVVLMVLIGFFTIIYFRILARRIHYR